jgi:hypothetical protein
MAYSDYEDIFITGGLERSHSDQISVDAEAGINIQRTMYKHIRNQFPINGVTEEVLDALIEAERAAMQFKAAITLLMNRANRDCRITKKGAPRAV